MDIGTLTNDLLQTGQGMLQHYQSFMIENPIIGNMASAEVTLVAGDVTTQLITEKKLNFKKLLYTALNAPIYGVALYGLIKSGDLAGNVIHDDPLVKSALGPNLWGNLLNTYFYVNNAIGEKFNYGFTAMKEQIKNYASIFNYEHDKHPGTKGFFSNFKEKYVDYISWKDYKVSVIGTLTAWNVIQWYNYSEMPEEMRVPFSLACGFTWMSILTYSSLLGGKRLKNKQDKEIKEIDVIKDKIK